MFDFYSLTLMVLWIFRNIDELSGNTYYTSFIEVCDYAGARNASKVEDDALFKDNEVHGGYFTVNKKLDINLYSLFVKSSADWKDAPLIVWLQGQPACTSLYAVFGQNGPHRVINADGQLTLIKNEYAWTDKFNVLYLDSMIFTGYSYAQNTSNILAYLEEMGSFLYDALYQFYQIFPNLSHNELYLAGEMYCGKYLLLLGQVIHKKNPISHVKMQLQGFYMGSAFSDPENMFEYSSLMYQIGLIDFSKMKEIQNMEESIRKGIRSQKYDSAQQQLLSVWIEMQLAGFEFPVDFTKPNASFEPQVLAFLQSPAFRQVFHLESKIFYPCNENVVINSAGRTLKAILEEDILKSVKHLIPPLLDNYRMLFYAGQFDLLVPYVHVTNFLRLLDWHGAEAYYNPEKTPRYNWYVDGDLAGYRKSAFNLTEVLVRNASQMVDASQPKWGLNLISSFINNNFENPQISKSNSTTNR